MAETGVADSTLIVTLYRNRNDTAVKSSSRIILQRLDSIGQFNFRYLPNETFTIYVVPSDYSKRYDDSTKILRFTILR